MYIPIMTIPSISFWVIKKIFFKLQKKGDLIGLVFELSLQKCNFHNIKLSIRDFMRKINSKNKNKKIKIRIVFKFNPQIHKEGMV